MTDNPLTFDEMVSSLGTSFGRIGEIPAGEAYLGKGDGTTTVIADVTQRLVYTNDGQTWTQTPLGQRVTITAVEGQAGVRVRLARLPENPQRVFVAGFTESTVRQAFGGVLPGEQQGKAAFFPDVGRIKDFRIAPQNPTGLSVHVNGGAYYDSTGAWATFGGGDLDSDISTAVGALSSGQHQMGVVILVPSTGDLDLLTNTAATGGAGDKDIWDSTEVMSILSGQTDMLPCGTIHLYYGQTAVSEDDIYRQADPRVAFSSPPSSTGSGIDYFPINLTTSLTIPTNKQIVTGAFTIGTGGTLTVNGKVTIV